MAQERLAELETLIDEFNRRSITSPERKEYLNCFLDGIKTEARTMLRFVEYAQRLDMLYSAMPTFLAPFKDTIQDRIAVDLGNAFSSAKALADNINRFSQAFYLPEGVIQERSRRIKELSEEKTASEALGSVYPLDKMKMIVQSGSKAKEIADLFAEFHEKTSWVRAVRNTSDHGYKHLLVKRDEKGFYLSGDLTGHVPEEQHYIGKILNAIQYGYIGLASRVFNSVLASENSVLRERNLRDKRMYPINKAKNNLRWLAPFTLKYAVIPSVVVGTLLGAIRLDNNYKIRQHKDERTIRQLRELSAFQRECMEVNKKAQRFAEAVDHLAIESQVMLNYTNKPEDFDSEKVRKILARLQKTAETLRND
jgi:hypothetical protein